MLLCTLDITSLYTNTPHMEGIQSTKEMLAIHKPPDTLPHNSYIIKLLELVLTNNHFEFNGEFYHQLSGTAMGTKLAPSYANLFMTKFEDKYVYTYPLQPQLWKRFIDDIFVIWPHGMKSLIKFIEHLNTVNPTIKFTSDISETRISFLDLTIYTEQPKLHTRLYTKPTDRHMYLNYFSEHPMSLKKSTPYSQFLRLKKIYSEIQHLLEPQIHMYLFFRWRNYPHDIILKAWMDTNKFTKEQLLHTENSETKDVPLMFITTYNRANFNFKELISKHWAYLGRCSATRDFGQRDFMITYRKPPSLKDNLVRARITQPKQKPLKAAKDQIHANIARRFHTQGKLKTFLTTRTTT